MVLKMYGQALRIAVTMLIFFLLAGGAYAAAGEENGAGKDGKNIPDGPDISALVVESQVYFEDFESGYNGWYASNGVWEIGNSTIEPAGCYKNSSGCAGTILDGDYPPYTDSALRSPYIILPSVAPGEEMYLRFWHWFDYNIYAYGYTAISVYNTTTGTWEAPVQVGDNIGYMGSGVWSFTYRDITKYAGKKIQIHFQHYNGDRFTESGWTIDDVEIIRTVPFLNIAVDSPNGGESWAAGTKQVIKWTYAGNVGTKVRIDLLKGDTHYRGIISNTNTGSGGKGSYNWTIPATLTPGTDYKILVTSLYPVYSDSSNGNFNIIDITPPASITALKNVTYRPNYINWTWKDPSTFDFSRVMIFLNGIFRTNVTKGNQSYNATGLRNNTLYRISTHTVDSSGNINMTWVNRTAKTSSS